MEKPPLPKNSPLNSKKRAFSGGSSRCMDTDDVVEIVPPPISRTPKLAKQKEVIVHDVIELDKDEETAAAMFIDERVDRSIKGKAIKNSSDGYGDHQTKVAAVNNIFGPSGMETSGSVTAVEAAKGFSTVSHNFINLDGHSSDVSIDDDDYADLFLDEFMDVDEYALLQSHFDKVDIPPGIEAPIPWLPDPPKSKVDSVSGSSSVNLSVQVQSGAVGFQGSNSSFSPWSLESHFNMRSTILGNSSLKTKLESISHPPRLDVSSSWKLPKAARSKKKQAALQYQGSSPNLPVGVESSKSQWLLGPFQRKKKLVSSSSSTNYNSGNQFEAMKLPSGVEPSPWAYYLPDSVNKQASSTSYYPPGVQPTSPWLSDPVFKTNSKPSNSTFYDPLGSIYPPGEVAGVPWVNAQTQKNAAAVGFSTTPARQISSSEMDEILRKFKGFKQFDTIEDHSDHHYTSHGSSTKQPSKNWAKRIQEEWKILEKDLPDTIFVRVYETRMDLLRAVIVGAEGTPYHDGLFFFDVFFPTGYPNSPPNVYYHSGGLRLNPNLYNCGKVCLSLLNTWSGNKNEKWIPGMSTMLQVLVSIQGLILNTKPYFNEPGYARMNGSAAGETRSQQYNEDTFILSLRTMIYMMRRPPKNFEDFVLGHFRDRAHDILVACKAYMDGAQVGCLVKGGVQDVDAGDKSCSQRFKDSLAGYVPMLVKEFTQIGAKDCEKFLSPPINGNMQIANMPQAATSMVSC